MYDRDKPTEIIDLIYGHSHNIVNNLKIRSVVLSTLSLEWPLNNDRILVIICYRICALSAMYTCVLASCSVSIT